MMIEADLDIFISVDDYWLEPATVFVLSEGTLEGSMKTLVPALLIAFLITGMFFSPAAAASAPAGLASVDCGDTYVVQPGNYLAQIAAYCGTTVASILALNPQIIYPSLIYPGQVLRLTSSAPVSTTTTTTYSGYARVSLSATRAEAGDDVVVYVSGFPAYAEIDYRVGLLGEDFTDIYDGTVAANGTDSQTITIPDDAEKGEYWVVEVVTTSLADEIAVKSHSIYISQYNSTTTYTYSGYARVSLSATRVAVGDDVTVYVSGFPAYAEIDYRVGLQGEDFSVVYDGTVGSTGSDTLTIDVPDDAEAGEYWVVQVVTTSLKNIVSVTSHTIYITD
jgi:protein involved in polysaccharide export with SLBB domain